MSSSKLPECVIFDPSGWKEGDVYYALIGNKNHRPGYEGDSTSLFKSGDLREWEYVGPFYKSDRRWTEEIEDCACSNFFPFGDKHMLLMHTHRPYGKTQYYIGRYENEQFYPETNGQLSHLGSLVAGPETLLDDRGRRIFWGWVREARGGDWAKYGWNSMMTLPWRFTPARDNSLLIDPVEELRSLRYDERRHGDVTLSEGEERTVEGFESDCMEIKLTIEPKDAARFGIKLLCSPGGEEETVVTYDAERQQFVVDFERASEDEELTYGRDARDNTRGVRQQNRTLPSGWPSAAGHRRIRGSLHHRDVRQLAGLHRAEGLSHQGRQQGLQSVHEGQAGHSQEHRQVGDGRYEPMVIPCVRIQGA